MGLVFFKINKHKKFNYKPLYYNEQKDALDELKKKTSSESEASLEEMRQKIKSRWQLNRTVEKNKYPTTKIAFVLFILFAIVYFLLR